MNPEKKDQKNSPLPEKKRCTIHPAADVFDRYDGVEISFEIPGSTQQDVAVEVKDHQLTLEAPSKLKRFGMPINYKRSFYLSEAVDHQKITAQVKDGVLTLWLPKTADARPKKIKVK